MHLEFGHLLTRVKNEAVDWYLNTEYLDISDASLFSDPKAKVVNTLVFEISSYTQDKAYLGNVTLGLCELAFEYLPLLAEKPADLEKLELVWRDYHPNPVSRPDQNDGVLPIWNHEAYFERPFFSDDEDHRYMWGEVRENFQSPHQVVFDFKFHSFDPSYGRDLESGNLRVSEQVTNWRLVKRNLVRPDKFFERVSQQTI